MAFAGNRKGLCHGETCPGEGGGQPVHAGDSPTALGAGDGGP